MAHRRSGADGFVRRLRFLFLFVGIRRLRQIFGAVLRCDVFAHFGQRFGRDAGGIGTHVGDEADQAFFAKLDAFIQTLGDHHGALHAETQFAGRVLLQLAGGERRSRVAAALFLFGGADDPVGVFERRADLFGFFGVPDFNLLFAFAKEAGVEGGRLGASQDARRSSSILFSRKP